MSAKKNEPCCYWQPDAEKRLEKVENYMSEARGAYSTLVWIVKFILLPVMGVILGGLWTIYINQRDIQHEITTRYGYLKKGRTVVDEYKRP